MTHPTPEDLVTLLYDELDPPQRRKIEQHLEACKDCRTAFSRHQKTRMSLETWQLPRTRHSRGPKWSAVAAAAAIAVLATVAGARLWILEGQVRELRQELAGKATDSSVAGLRDEIRLMAAEHERVRANDRDGFAAALRRSQVDATANYAALRKELETVAILTEAGFQTTQSEIAQLATTARDTSSTQ